jgi:hypothetical protein
MRDFSRPSSKLADVQARDLVSPDMRARVEEWKSEIREINFAEQKDFKTWWQHRVKETRHWGGSDGGGLFDFTFNSIASDGGDAGDD